MLESHIVPSFRSVAGLQGTPIHIDQPLADGEEIGVILETPGGHIIGSVQCFLARSFVTAGA